MLSIRQKVHDLKRSESLGRELNPDILAVAAGVELGPAIAVVAAPGAVSAPVQEVVLVAVEEEAVEQAVQR